MNIEEFKNELKKINIDITDNQLNQLEKYYELLIEWNQKINLTRITIKEEVYLKHFYDSLTINKIINLKEVNSFCDFGTGAGFPGLVIKIMFPHIKVTLIDSLQKRTNFLKLVIDELNLKNIDVYHERVEEFAKKTREEYDLVTARAVSSLNILLEYGIPMVKKDKYFLAMKANVIDELEEAKKISKLLNTILINRQEFFLPKENSIRNLLLFQKKEKTNIKYPRSNKEIKKDLKN